MLEDLRGFIDRIPTSYSINMPRFNNYLYNLRLGILRLVLRNKRFTTDPVPSAGIDYLNSLITRADIKYLLKFPNDLDRFSRVLREYKSPAYGDIIRQYAVRERNFIYCEKAVPVEYLLVTDDFDILDHMPIGSNESYKWMNVRPFKMLSNDSTEILLDITSSKLKYKKYPPKEVVFSINIPKLLMMYTKYRLLHPEEFIENTNNYPFIYKSCILPMLYDNIKTWLMKIIYDITELKLKDPSVVYNDDRLISGEKSTFVMGNRQSALSEIDDLLMKCAQGKVKPDEVVVSLQTGLKTNLLSDMNYLMTSHYVGNRGNQYRYGEFEREFFTLGIMLNIYKLQPESNRTLELKRVFDIVYRRLENIRFWSSVGNPFVAAEIERKFRSLNTFME